MDRQMIYSQMIRVQFPAAMEFSAVSQVAIFAKIVAFFCFRLWSGTILVLKSGSNKLQPVDLLVANEF